MKETFGRRGWLGQRPAAARRYGSVGDRPQREVGDQPQRAFPRPVQRTLLQILVPDFECVPLFHIAGSQTANEPFGPLLRGTVGERLGDDDPSSRFLLQAVVTDRSRGVECLLDIPFFQDLPVPFGVVSPDASQKIRLQLQTDGKFVGLFLAQTRLLAVDLIADP